MSEAATIQPEQRLFVLPASLARWDTLLLPMLVGSALRLIGLDRLSIWLDEATSLNLARQAPAMIWASRVDTHPPLYHLLLHYWLLFDTGAGWARLLSALLGILTIVAIYNLGRVAIGPRAGLACAWLLELSPWHIWYSQEIRMYALLCLFGTLALLGAALWLHTKKPLYALAYVLFMLGGLYTEYTMALLWAALGVLSLLLFRRDLGRAGWTGWLLAQVAVVVGCLPLLPRLATDLPVFFSGDFLRTALGFAGNYVLLLGGAALALSLAALIVWVGLRTRRPELAGRLEVAVLLLLLLAAVVFILLPGNLITRRTLLVLAPLVYLGGAWAIGRARWPVVNLRAFLLVSVVALLLMFVTLQKEPWRDVAAQTVAQAQQGDLVLFYADWMQEPFDYYNQGRVATARLDAAELGSPLAKRLQNYKRVWLVLASLKQVDPDGRVARWFANHYGLEQTTEYYHICARLYSTTAPANQPNVDTHCGW